MTTKPVTDEDITRVMNMYDIENTKAAKTKQQAKAHAYYLANREKYLAYAKARRERLKKTKNNTLGGGVTNNNKNTKYRRMSKASKQRAIKHKQAYRAAGRANNSIPILYERHYNRWNMRGAFNNMTKQQRLAACKRLHTWIENNLSKTIQIDKMYGRRGDGWWTETNAAANMLHKYETNNTYREKINLYALGDLGIDRKILSKGYETRKRMRANPNYIKVAVSRQMAREANVSTRTMKLDCLPDDIQKRTCDDGIRIGIHFEQLVKKHLTTQGYRIIPRTIDGGIDILATKDDLTYVISCKNKLHRCGPDVVRDLYGAVHLGIKDGTLTVDLSKVIYCVATTVGLTDEALRLLSICGGAGHHLLIWSGRPGAATGDGPALFHLG